MKVIDALNKQMLGIIYFVYIGERYLKKPLIKLTKFAKTSCKVFSDGAIPDPFLDLKSSKMEQTKGIDALKK